MKKNRKWILIGTVIAIAGAILYGIRARGIEAEVSRVAKGEMKQYLEETAQVMSREKQTVYIEGTGKVVEIKADEGDVVKQGDLLASLDKKDLELQLKDAEAGIAAAKAQLKGTDLVNYANKIDLAQVAVDQAKISYDSAQRDLENAKKLYAAQAMSADEFNKAQAAFKEAEAAWNSAKLQLADVKKGAPEYLKNTYKAQLDQAVISRDTILRNMEKQEVRAPIDGIIMERLVEKNVLAAPPAAAFIIGSVNHLELEADILADDINDVKIGNEVEISGKPIGDTVLKGKVTKIAPVAITVTSSLGVNQKRVPVTIALAGESTMLKPGYDLDVKIITAVKKQAMKVPDSAVFSYGGGSGVFLVENGKARVRTVKKGMESGDFVEITEGVQEGDLILVKPDNSIKEGARIKPLDESTEGGDTPVQ